MKRCLVNGSPRGRKSNSRIVLSWLLEGFSQGGARDESEILDLATLGDDPSIPQGFLEADEIVFIMPLYTDSMPGIVKRFIDSLSAVSPVRLAGKRVFFIVQSGFPESLQSAVLVSYLARLAQRMEWDYGGTLVKGGLEGIQIMPEIMTKKIKKRFVSVGEYLVHHGRFDPEMVRLMAKPVTLSLPLRVLFTLISYTGLTNGYWNMMLKKHGAYECRFDAPYGTAYKKNRKRESVSGLVLLP